ncbi:helix-turn-helix domain-containing protein [Nocardia sp. NPDC050408]|uniref:helix-turn-helix domain-containing protein n=1 Tax=Nocardia sp. NPDC050408 TaxID=3364319 RepID=UPI003791AF12
MTDILDRPPALVLDGDALDPIGGGGALVGYGRVSTKGQNLDRQMLALREAGCQKIFSDKTVPARSPRHHHPGRRLVFHVFHVFVALAEFIRELIVDGTNEGLAAARARGQRLGRPPAMTTEQIRQARAMLTQPAESVLSIARLLGVSRSTVYKYLPELSSAASSDVIEPPNGQQIEASSK